MSFVEEEFESVVTKCFWECLYEKLWKKVPL